MDGGLKKKYGLFTAIAMVIGIVMGSGVFFKAERVLNATGGNLPLGILAWGIGGAIMVICAYVFATMAAKYEYVNGLVDYAEVVVGKKYAYHIGWFLSIVYYPAITSVLAWVSARYTCVLIGWPITGGECMTLACFYLVAVYALSMLSPVLAGRFQVSTTIIKLIPLILMAIVGTVVGLANGTTVQNFTNVVQQDISGNPLFTAVVSTSFAYEGWIVATSINAELKDAKKNLPLALTAGTLIVMVVYILYYIGLAGAASNQVMMEQGEQGVLLAFKNIFGRLGGILFVFVIISCLGTLNGLMMGCTRGIYALAVRGKGPAPKTLSQVDTSTNMPTNSGIMGLLMCAVWLTFFYGTNLAPQGWFGSFAFDSSELPIVALYVLYIPIFIKFILKEKDLPPFKRFVMPVLAIACCLLIMVAAYFAHGFSIVWFLLVWAVCTGLGWAFYSAVKS
ncbi:APC family permease [Ruminococcaceae bacterium OttesenSCG-928-A16]|nr:APC family permease [Ruminococcaceae bacterium OttesenSCG-928-A16]